MVVLPGFEPRQAEPKTAVLPLHHKTILTTRLFVVIAMQNYVYFFYCANFFVIFFAKAAKLFGDWGLRGGGMEGESDPKTIGLTRRG